MSHNEALRIRQRIAARAGQPCAVVGCSRSSRKLGQYCGRHTLRLARHGSPTQRTIRLYEINPYLRYIDRFLTANEGHPALVQAFDALSDQLKTAASIPILHRPAHRAWQVRLRMDLGRLHKDGVDGREVFRMIAGIWQFSLCQPGALKPLSRELWFCISRRVLNLRQRQPSHLRAATQGSRLPAMALETLGRDLVRLLHRLLTAMSEAIEKQGQEANAAKAAIEASLSVPFNTTTPQAHPSTTN